ncbi:MAG TPA: hypothetical protein VGB49_07840 [Caulobacteraceae bacterium]
MSEEKVTTERVVERPATHTTTVVDRGERSGGGMGGVLIGLAVLIIVAIGAYFLLNANRNDAVRTEAVSEAASSVSNAAESVGDAAQNAVPAKQ